MRVSSILTLFIVALLVCMAFAEPQAKPVETDAALKKHVSELNSKIQSLTDDLKTLRTSLDAIRRENESIKKSVHIATERASAAPSDDVINNLRNQINELRIAVKQSTILHQFTTALNDSKAVVERLYNKYALPYTKQALALSKKYLVTIQSQSTVTFGATQSILSKLYHAVRVQLNPILDQSRSNIERMIKSLNIPLEYKKHAPLAATLVISMALFLVATIAFAIVYGIISSVLSLLCCCCRSKKTQKKKQTPVQATATNQLSGKKK